MACPHRDRQPQPLALFNGQRRNSLSKAGQRESLLRRLSSAGESPDWRTIPPVIPLQSRYALKEWACVVQALREGRQIILLRKGGIHEPHGEFRAAHPEFFLAPAREHQKAELLKPEAASRYARLFDPVEATTNVQLDAFARLEAAIPLDDPHKAFRLADEHAWTDEYVRMRVGYKPEKPLFVLALRVFALESPVILPWTESYAGCRSWFELPEAVEARTVGPVISDEEFIDAMNRVRARI